MSLQTENKRRPRPCVVTPNLKFEDDEDELFYLFAPAAQKRVALGGGRLGSSIELFDPTFTFTPNPSSPPSPLMAGLAHQKTPVPPPSPIAARFGIGGRAVAAAPEFAGHRSVCRSASAAGGLLVGASGPGPTKHPPPSPSSHFKRERMDSAGSISGNNRGSGGDIALRQLDAELGRGFVIIALYIYAPYAISLHTDMEY